MYRALQPEISKLKPILPSIPAFSSQEKRSSSVNLKKPHQKAFLFSETGLKESKNNFLSSLNVLIIIFSSFYLKMPNLLG